MEARSLFGDLPFPPGAVVQTHRHNLPPLGAHAAARPCLGVLEIEIFTKLKDP